MTDQEIKNMVIKTVAERVNIANDRMEQMPQLKKAYYEIAREFSADVANAFRDTIFLMVVAFPSWDEHDVIAALRTRLMNG